MKVLHYNLQVNINHAQTPPESGCFLLYYRLISPKRCKETPQGAYPQDLFNDVIDLTPANNFINCYTFTGTDTTLTLSGNISYDDTGGDTDNNPNNYEFDRLSCHTYLIFYLLPCCIGNYDCASQPPQLTQNLATNASFIIIDVSSQVNKTTCRRYRLLLGGSGFNTSLTYNINYTTCGIATTKDSSPTGPAGTCDGIGNPINNPYLGVSDVFTVPSNFIATNPNPVITAGDYKSPTIEFCSSTNPIVYDQNGNIVPLGANTLQIVEDINESKDPATGACCSKCIKYHIIPACDLTPYRLIYQDCRTGKLLSNVVTPPCSVSGAPPLTVCAVEGTLRYVKINNNQSDPIPLGNCDTTPNPGLTICTPCP